MTNSKNNLKVVLVSSLPVQISSPQGCSWSVDNRLALITQRGIYVYQLVPDPSNKQPKLNFLKTFIENDIEVNPWQLECVVPDDVLAQLPRQIRNEVTLDRVLAPHMVGGEQLFRQMRLVGWSPKLWVDGEWECLLMTVTVDHRARLVKQTGRKWITQVELSAQLKKYVDSVELGVVEQENTDVATVENLRAKAYFLAISAFAWKDKGDDEEKVQTLVTGQMNGMVVKWKVSSAGNKVEAEVESHCSAELGPVSALALMEIDGVELALVGGFDGRVGAVKLGEKLVNLGWVWRDPDRLALSRIEAVGKGQVVLAKGNFLLRLNIGVVNDKLVVEDCPQSVNVGMSKVAGIVKDENDLVAVTQKGEVKVWSGSELTQLDTDVDRQHYWCYGLAASRNKCIYVSLECVSSFSDHLIMRERGRVVFWVNKSLVDIKNSLRHLKNEDCSDLREAWRVLAVQTKLNNCDIEKAEGIRVMRMHWWETAVLATTTGSHQFKEARENWEIKLKLETAKRILKGDGDAKMKQVATRFISDFGEGTGDVMEVNEDDWKCKICGEGFGTQDTVRVIRCLGGHVWPRCVATLKPCDTPILLTCGWCKSNALLQHRTRCDLCEGPLAQI